MNEAYLGLGGGNIWLVCCKIPPQGDCASVCLVLTIDVYDSAHLVQAIDHGGWRGVQSRLAHHHRRQSRQTG